MKLKRVYLTYIFALLVFFIILVFIFNSQVFNNSVNIASPLPNFLTSFINNQVKTLEVWVPSSKKKIMGVKIEIPKISARSALIYDLTSDEVLFEKSAKEKMPMASLTKIMTAVIAIENKVDKYFVDKKSLVGEDSMGLSKGETYALEDLLYGLMLVSGNDAAETLANNYIYGREKFIEAMNNKAKTLGLKDTNFTNPTGLEGDGNQHITAYDLLAITRYALKDSLFRKVAAAVDYHIPYSSYRKEHFLQNETNLLTSYPGVMGVKTGYTPEAGFCLVTYLSYQNHNIIGIILGSDNRRQEMKNLLDYSLKIQGILPPSHS